MSLDLAALYKDVPPAAKKLGIVGFPLAHTLSPAMHTAAIAALGLDAVYRKVEVAADDWPAFLAQARRLPLDGFNVTVPYKETIDLVVNVSELESATGSINTVLRTDEGWDGHSTDGRGFLMDLAENGLDPRGKRVTLLGAGGSARALLFTFGFAKIFPAELRLINRSQERARKLAEDFKDIEKDAFPVTVCASEDEKRRAVEEAELIINATAAGLRPQDAPPVDLKWVRRGAVVYDLIYHRETELLAAAKKAGARAVGGLGMLVNQGALAFEIWFRNELSGNRQYTPKALRSVMRAAAEAELKKRR